MKRNAIAGLGILFFCLLALPGAGADTGDRAGNGGDPLAAELVARGYYVLQTLKLGGGGGILSPAEILALEESLLTTRVELVDTELVDSTGKRVVTLVTVDPADPVHKLIRLQRKDWGESERLRVDLVRVVLHAYLQAMGINDDDYVRSSQLTVTERDFQNRKIVNPDCPSGQLEPVRIDFQLASDFPSLRGRAYVNGVEFDPANITSSRDFVSDRLCTTRYYSFAIAIGGFSRTLTLHGGQSVTVWVPGGGESYNR